MASIVNIYELIDPVSYKPRYVGKTITDLSDRLKVHIHQSKIAVKHTHKEAWIKGLLNKGLRPIINLIEQVEDSNWVDREMYWISKYRLMYQDLCNLSIGGDGYSGARHSEDWKQALSQKMKGNKYGVGRKWTEGQREKIMNGRTVWNKGTKGVMIASEKQKATMSLRMTGEKHPQAKLSNEEVSKIRQRYVNGESRKTLSIEFEINYSHMCKILKNKIRCVR
jgi:hypothetical protein